MPLVMRAIVASVVALLGWGFPASSVAGEARHYIDQYVVDNARAAGVIPSPPATTRVLVRRLAYDLTGLPPEPWLNDAVAGGLTSNELETVVEGMLNSPAFGERLASMWMNVARYAEDQAHQVGNDVKHFYPNAFRYRQWVVDAFNRDLPYDDFIRLQLAGDLYPETSQEDLPALGFLGLGPKYYNRGRLEVMADEWEDRVDTVTRGFLGLTVACARCHDHKFDAIPTEDYYALAGVFASTKMVNAPYGKPEDELTEEEKKSGLHTVHIVAEGKVQDLPVFVRGNVERKGDTVPRRFLSYFYQGDEQAPEFTEGSGRRELAEVIASPTSTHVAQVYVNRVWQEFFGRGIVATPSNFGTLGEEATHPELLERLAQDFMAHGWSTKWLVRQIVSSATYRQSSLANADNLAVDPENRFLWRMPQRRLPVEMWRDSLLVFAGNLDPVGGRSLRLDDPKNDRRTLYGRVSRKKLNTLLMNHDYPDPNVHSAKRAVTTTPLQKLYALNSGFVVKQAALLAERLSVESTSNQDWVERLYQRVFFRSPRSEEVALADTFLQQDGDTSARRRHLFAQAILTANEVSYVD